MTTLLDGHVLSVSLARLDFLAGLLDGGEDGFVWEAVVFCLDLCGLVLEVIETTSKLLEKLEAMEFI